MAQLLRAAVLLLPLALSVFALAAPASAMKGAGDLGQLGAVVMRRGGRTCRGTVGECMEYFDVDAEGEGDVAAMVTGKRRVLQSGSGYIGYDALRRDSVPCSQRGASYYNCQPGAEANPYSRGCSAITQCRG
ncbi:rapid alkalinization factor-like [Phragmites australis]|uniref:rapid alkalinization factor-like n=1 Tax=Phragmites australis TaxID=29695 RepID=UPI002D774EA2|nr:rapid alkalinization factor-like [Phragmites australis]